MYLTRLHYLCVNWIVNYRENRLRSLRNTKVSPLFAVFDWQLLCQAFIKDN